MGKAHPRAAEHKKAPHDRSRGAFGSKPLYAFIAETRDPL
jgi:hypothetical protein